MSRMVVQLRTLLKTDNHEEMPAAATATATLTTTATLQFRQLLQPTVIYHLKSEWLERKKKED